MLDAIILAGGKGTRLASIVQDRPKPMADVAGRPFLEWLLLELRSQGVQRVILSIGHLGGVVREHFGDGTAFGIDVVYAQEESPLGTGGAVRAALEQTRGRRVLALNGDSYCRFDAAAMLRAHILAGARATIAVTHVADAGRFGAVQRAPDGTVRAFREKDPSVGAGWINAGVYVLERELLEPLRFGEAYSIERDVLAAQAGAGVHSVAVRGPFIDIGTPESFVQAQQVLSGEEARLRGETSRSAWPQARRAERVVRRLHESADTLRRAADECTPALLEAVGRRRAASRRCWCRRRASSPRAR